MKKSLKDRIYDYLKARPNHRVPSGEIQRLVTQKTSYTAANATRRLRELAEDGLIEVEYEKNHAHYYYKPPKTQTVRTIEIVDGVAREVYKTVST